MVGANLKAETMKLMEKRSALETEMNVIIERLCQPGGPGLSGNLVDSEGFPRSDIDIPVVRAERHRLAELRSDHKEITEKINQNIQVLHSARLAPNSSSPKDSGFLKCIFIAMIYHRVYVSQEEIISTQLLYFFLINLHGNDGVANNQNSVVGNTVPSASSHNVVVTYSPSSMDVDMIVSIPFAVVDEIADASPTAEDGLQLGDQLVKFGTVEYQVGENLLQKLASEAQANQGHAVPVVVMRQGAPINLSVTPRVWPGRGLLGYVCLFFFLYNAMHFMIESLLSMCSIQERFPKSKHGTSWTTATWSLNWVTAFFEAYAEIFYEIMVYLQFPDLITVSGITGKVVGFICQLQDSVSEMHFGIINCFFSLQESILV
ncbi:unnamed protein product [Dovyalis caffra]|uniref:Nas2 N-terminal domain-containing protein n=1 Tax=Dovyalis caffra TaxID=77055 RepID=A0AAV1RRT5_9ROSI|nr:unnamed protein product [Dovyalis caffra]